MAIPPAEFTRAMARVPGPVTVVTTIDAAGQRWGFTASSFSSLSLSPPLVLICLDKAASTYEAFATTDRFMINVLRREQSAIALRFARSGVDRFADGDVVPLERGLPGIPEALVRVACSLHQVLDGGDHSILIGRVEATHVGDGAPLIYCDRGFQRLSEDAPQPLQGVGSGSEGRSLALFRSRR
ncbi:flavin reductase family protein [Micromonospora halophytica]|uniref:NADH-FMN oxidoreductase RutF, flavin reductase (DIM6/NTAB) family n=1 Tax=Micromonospora halophytica TaxID=47864 RepID=A0A1C5JFD3_9ACTN|nr:flavin reductase family protein [Micromonospora halophytica]SCG69262.1 NADH-FMN oxidoreductase RutF, flavin reductase (DIM6/NTAB) family [Micromonospora halophytica]